MANLIELPTHKDSRGNLTVIEKILPFEIKRVYYTYNIKASRGGHSHSKNIQALINLNGSCIVSVDKGIEKVDYKLDQPTKMLILDAMDWHTMHTFSIHSILLVLASEYHDKNDYIYEPP
jgi:hypothetical protein